MFKTSIACAGILLGVLAAATTAASAQEKIRFGTDWRADAERGGYYQALAKGFYKNHGLDVTIVQGGPGIDNARLIAADALDMVQVSSSFYPLTLLEAGAPVRAVAAFFQKSPQGLMTHPRDDIKTLADMKGKPIMISKGAINTYWVWLKAKYGFDDSQIRPMSFAMAPFLVDKTAIKQTFITSDPFLTEKEGLKAQHYLLADYGYGSYAAMVLAPQKLIDTKPQVVQAFVDASIEGWKSFIEDPAPAMSLIKPLNTDITDAEVAFVIAQFKKYQMIDKGDAATLGIGAMTDARWKEFFDVMASQGIYKPDMDYKKAYTLQFINKKHGM